MNYGRAINRKKKQSAVNAKEHMLWCWVFSLKCLKILLGAVLKWPVLLEIFIFITQLTSKTRINPGPPITWPLKISSTVHRFPRLSQVPRVCLLNGSRDRGWGEANDSSNSTFLLRINIKTYFDINYGGNGLPLIYNIPWTQSSVSS